MDATDAPTIGGIIGIIAATVGAAWKVVSNQRKTERKRRESYEPPMRLPPVRDQFTSLAAEVGALAQRVHDQENLMTRYEADFKSLAKDLTESMGEIDDTVNGLSVQHASSNAAIQRDLLHLKEQIQEVKDRLNERSKS